MGHYNPLRSLQLGTPARPNQGVAAILVVERLYRYYLEANLEPLFPALTRWELVSLGASPLRRSNRFVLALLAHFLTSVMMHRFSLNIIL